MTYQNPDPLREHDLDRNVQIDPSIDRDYGSNAMWGWIAGAVVLVLLLVFLFGGSNQGTNTASNQPTAPVVNTPPANNIANAPRSNTRPPATVTVTLRTTGGSLSMRRKCRIRSLHGCSPGLCMAPGLAFRLHRVGGSRISALLFDFSVRVVNF